MNTKSISLRTAWIALVAGALAMALVPAGLALDRRLSGALEREVRTDLAMAPDILADRIATRADALMMHAKEVAGAAELAGAVAAGDSLRAVRIGRSSIPAPDEGLVLVPALGHAWAGPSPEAPLLEATRRGEMPVSFGYSDGSLYRFSVAPISSAGEWLGAAGVFVPVDQAMAATLAGLTRSQVVVFGRGGQTVAATADSALVPVLADSLDAWRAREGVQELSLPEAGRYWAATAPLGSAGSVVFLRDAARELAVLPDLRRGALLAGVVALGVALLFAGLLAAKVARPVQALAEASRRLADGDFTASVPDSRLREVERVSRAFRDMRSSLAEKIRQLTRANEELEERQQRLQALQAELVQRDRLAATGRLVTELAHEIRNPVASVRNCLEIIHRRLEDDADLREFSEMAIEELLRMHRLAEKMLDANRPLDPEADSCDPTEVARKVAELAGTAAGGGGPSVQVEGDSDLDVAMGPDALKQVLLNLVENAREAMKEDGFEDGSGSAGAIVLRIGGPGERGADPAVIEVLDEGPGIDPDDVGRIFDPFFTTKDEVHGVGLGLFVAQGLVRRHGGRITASDRNGGGARFVVELPVVDPEAEP